MNNNTVYSSNSLQEIMTHPLKNEISKKKSLQDPNSRKKIRRSVLKYVNKFLPQKEKIVDATPQLLEASYQKGLKEGSENVKIKTIDPVAEAKKESIKEEENDKQRFKKLYDKRNITLFRTFAIFPFDLFPDEIIIEITKINVICREFFLTENRHCLPLKNVQDVILESAPFFATLKIISTPFVENTVTVRYLTKHDARKAQRIIDGLLLTSKENIDLSHLEKNDLVNRLEEIGSSRSIDT